MCAIIHKKKEEFVMGNIIDRPDGIRNIIIIDRRHLRPLVLAILLETIIDRLLLSIVSPSDNCIGHYITYVSLCRHFYWRRIVLLRGQVERRTLTYSTICCLGPTISFGMCCVVSMYYIASIISIV